MLILFLHQISNELTKIICLFICIFYCNERSKSLFPSCACSSVCDCLHFCGRWLIWEIVFRCVVSKVRPFEWTPMWLRLSVRFLHKPFCPILVQSKDKCIPQIKNTSSIYLGPASCFWLLTFSSLSKSIIWSQPITDCLLNPISVPPTTTYTILLLYNQWSASSEDFKQPWCNNYPAVINILIHCACV